MYKMEFYFVGKNKIMTFLGKQMISQITMLKEMKPARFRRQTIICILSIIKHRIKKNPSKRQTQKKKGYGGRIKKSIKESDFDKSMFCRDMKM